MRTRFQFLIRLIVVLSLFNTALAQDNRPAGDQRTVPTVTAFNVVKKDEPQTPTVIAHNGEEGQIIRGRGELTFRIGDFF